MLQPSSCRVPGFEHGPHDRPDSIPLRIYYFGCNLVAACLDDEHMKGAVRIEQPRHAITPQVLIGGLNDAFGFSNHAPVSTFGRALGAETIERRTDVVNVANVLHSDRGDNRTAPRPLDHQAFRFEDGERLTNRNSTDTESFSQVFLDQTGAWGEVPQGNRGPELVGDRIDQALNRQTGECHASCIQDSGSS